MKFFYLLLSFNMMPEKINATLTVKIGLVQYPIPVWDELFTLLMIFYFSFINLGWFNSNISVQFLLKIAKIKIAPSKLILRMPFCNLYNAIF